MKDFYKEEKRGWRREGEGDKRDPFYSSISVEFQIRKKNTFYLMFLKPLCYVRCICKVR